MKDRYWIVEGFNGQNKIYYKHFKIGYFTNNKIEQLLKTLVAKSGLSIDEIIGAHAKYNTKISNDLLLVNWDQINGSCMCGVNPYFTARIVKSDVKLNILNASIIED